MGSHLMSVKCEGSVSANRTDYMEQVEQLMMNKVRDVTLEP